jgi:hypothetical protein
VIRPSKDLDIVPDPNPENLERLATLLATLGARHIGLGDFDADEFPSTRRARRTFAPVPTADAAYGPLAADAIEGELDGIVVRVCSLEHLIAMKRAEGRPPRSRRLAAPRRRMSQASCRATASSSPSRVRAMTS